jgi:U3 small nucleolar ribonucleoprotein component
MSFKTLSTGSAADVRLARTTEAIQIIRKIWEWSKKEKDNKIIGKNSGFIEFNGQYLKSRMQNSTRLLLRRKYHYTWQQAAKKRSKLLQNTQMAFNYNIKT